MINKFLARTTTSKLHVIRILYFYLAILMYNLWVMLNYREQDKIIADSLKICIFRWLLFFPSFLTWRKELPEKPIFDLLFTGG